MGYGLGSKFSTKLTKRGGTAIGILFSTVATAFNRAGKYASGKFGMAGVYKRKLRA